MDAGKNDPSDECRPVLQEMGAAVLGATVVGGCCLHASLLMNARSISAITF